MSNNPFAQDVEQQYQHELAQSTTDVPRIHVDDLRQDAPPAYEEVDRQSTGPMTARPVSPSLPPRPVSPSLPPRPTSPYDRPPMSPARPQAPLPQAGYQRPSVPPPQLYSQFPPTSSLAPGGYSDNMGGMNNQYFPPQGPPQGQQTQTPVNGHWIAPTTNHAPPPRPPRDTSSTYPGNSRATYNNTRRS